MFNQSSLFSCLLSKFKKQNLSSYKDTIRIYRETLERSCNFLDESQTRVAIHVSRSEETRRCSWLSKKG